MRIMGRAEMAALRQDAMDALERIAGHIRVRHLEHAEAVQKDLNLVAKALGGTDGQD